MSITCDNEACVGSGSRRFEGETLGSIIEYNYIWPEVVIESAGEAGGGYVSVVKCKTRVFFSCLISELHVTSSAPWSVLVQ